MNEIEIPTASGHVPWNKGKLLMLGQKSALTLRAQGGVDDPHQSAHGRQDP